MIYMPAEGRTGNQGFLRNENLQLPTEGKRLRELHPEVGKIILFRIHKVLRERGFHLVRWQLQHIQDQMLESAADILHTANHKAVQKDQKGMADALKQIDWSTKYDQAVEEMLM